MMVGNPVTTPNPDAGLDTNYAIVTTIPPHNNGSADTVNPVDLFMGKCVANNGNIVALTPTRVASSSKRSAPPCLVPTPLCAPSSPKSRRMDPPDIFSATASAILPVSLLPCCTVLDAAAAIIRVITHPAKDIGF